jgi:hypothetical protein
MADFFEVMVAPVFRLVTTAADWWTHLVIGV